MKLFIPQNFEFIFEKIGVGVGAIFRKNFLFCHCSQRHGFVLCVKLAIIFGLAINKI